MKDWPGFFVSSNCVRHGENLSLILFSIFLNDLVDHVSSKSQGLEIPSHSIQETLRDDTVEEFLDYLLLIKLFPLLNADDTVVFAETEHEFQEALNAMQSYCELWK